VGASCTGGEHHGLCLAAALVLYSACTPARPALTTRDVRLWQRRNRFSWAPARCCDGVSLSNTLSIVLLLYTISARLERLDSGGSFQLLARGPGPRILFSLAGHGPLTCLPVGAWVLELICAHPPDGRHTSHDCGAPWGLLFALAGLGAHACLNGNAGSARPGRGPWPALPDQLEPSGPSLQRGPRLTIWRTPASTHLVAAANYQPAGAGRGGTGFGLRPASLGQQRHRRSKCLSRRSARPDSDRAQKGAALVLDRNGTILSEQPTARLAAGKAPNGPANRSWDLGWPACALTAPHLPVGKACPMMPA